MKPTIKTAIAVLTSLLVACTSESGLNSEPTSSSPKSDLKKSSAGKPSPAPIEMTYKILNEPIQAGKEILIEVGFKSEVNSTIKSEITSTTKVASADQLSLLNANQHWQSEFNENRDRAPLPILKVSAPSNGLYYIRLMASIEQNGKRISKPFVIPIKVGNEPVEFDSVGEVVIDQNGDKVIIQDAETKN